MYNTTYFKFVLDIMIIKCKRPFKFLTVLRVKEIQGKNIFSFQRNIEIGLWAIFLFHVRGLHHNRYYDSRQYTIISSKIL